MVELGSAAIDERIAAAIYKAYEDGQKDWRRDHLGASTIGDEKCGRALWYSFRWVRHPRHEGRLLRLFETGQMEEVRVIRNLESIGVAVAKNPDGGQFHVVFLGGHFGGSTDAILRNVPGAPKTEHIGEFKTASKKKFEEFCSKGVRVANPGYFAQMQVYMLGRKLKRALFLVVCKDDDRIHTERVHFDSKYARGLVEHARVVISSPTPLGRISDDPTWFECRFCTYHEHCHAADFSRLERNCRTCTYSTPRENGTWHCARHDSIRSSTDQRHGCSYHVFVPHLLEPWTVIDASDGDAAGMPWVLYERNGKRMIDREKNLRPC